MHRSLKAFLTWFGLCALARSATPQGNYDLELLAQSGGAAVVIFDVGMDDAGTVVFRGFESSGEIRLFVVDAPGNAMPITPSGSGSYDGLATSRGVPSVSAVRRRPPGSTDYSIELWPSGPAGSGTVIEAGPMDFDSVQAAVEVNDLGSVAYWAVASGMGELRVDGTTRLTTALGAATSLPPVLADNGTLALKLNDGSIVKLPAAGGQRTVASPGLGFSLPVGRPQISHDGRFVFFTGDRGQGQGLFASASVGASETILHLAGEGVDGFSSTAGLVLRDVDTTADIAGNTYLRLLYTGTRAGVSALYTSHFSAIDPFAGILLGGGLPRRVLGPGSTVGGLTILNVQGQSKINRHGTVVSTVSLSDGTLGVIRATPRGPSVPGLGKVPPVANVRISIKRVTSSSGMHHALWSDANVMEMIRLANRNLERYSFAGVRYQLDGGIKNLKDPSITLGGTPWFETSSALAAGYETLAEANPTATLWRTDAVNVYLLSGTTQGCGVCSFPSTHPCTLSHHDIVTLSPQGCGSVSDLEGVTVTFLHELGHYFGVLHPHSSVCLGAETPPPCIFPYNNVPGPIPVPGDGIRDTPWDPQNLTMAAAQYGSCPSVLSSVVYNVMGYYSGTSSRLGVFTAGQLEVFRDYLFASRSAVVGPAKSTKAPVPSGP